MSIKKNILVIGASSFVGYNLYKSLKSDFNIHGTFCNNQIPKKKNFYKINLTNHLPFKVFNKVNFVKNLLFNDNARIYEYLDRSSTHSLIKQHLSGKINRRLTIWSLLYLEIYLQKNL